MNFHPSQDPLDDVDTSLVAAELITWVKSRVTLMGLTPEMWHDESSSVIISDFLSSKQNNRLIVFIVRRASLPSAQNSRRRNIVLIVTLFSELHSQFFVCVSQDEKPSLCFQSTASVEMQKAREVQYFLKAAGDVILTQDRVADRVQYGVISGSALESLLRMMNRVYLPTFLSNATWPDSALAAPRCSLFHSRMVSPFSTFKCNHCKLLDRLISLLQASRRISADSCTSLWHR